MTLTLLSKFGRLLLALSLSTLCQATPQDTQTPNEAIQPILIAAAQHVYANVIEQLGKPYVQVTTLASQPNQDPHMLALPPSVSRQLATVRLVAYNGAGYDSWLTPLLAASPSSSRLEINLAHVMGKRAGDNPHLWYLPNALRTFANTFHTFLLQTDPTHTAHYNANHQRFLASLAPIEARIAALRQRYQGTPITATEPVFDYMAQAIGLEMRQQSFQHAVMMEAQPSAKDILSFQNDLQQRRVKLLIYNTQTAGDMARHMLALAHQSGIPVLSITETLPQGQSYQDWIQSQLEALDQCLASHTAAVPSSGTK